MTQAPKSFDTISLLGDEHQGDSVALHASCRGSRDGQWREAIDERKNVSKSTITKNKSPLKICDLVQKINRHFPLFLFHSSIVPFLCHSLSKNGPCLLSPIIVKYFT